MQGDFPVFREGFLGRGRIFDRIRVNLKWVRLSRF